MPIAIPVYSVSSAELHQNGGNFSIEGRTAIRVRLTTDVTSGVEGGALTPIYVVSSAELHQNGGRWKVAGGAPLDMATITVGRPVSGRVAIPVWVVTTPSSSNPDASLDFSDVNNSMYLALFAQDF